MAKGEAIEVGIPKEPSRLCPLDPACDLKLAGRAVEGFAAPQFRQVMELREVELQRAVVRGVIFGLEVEIEDLGPRAELAPFWGVEEQPALKPDERNMPLILALAACHFGSPRTEGRPRGGAWAAAGEPR
jgi:hypothetical protein